MQNRLYKGSHTLLPFPWNHIALARTSQKNGKSGPCKHLIWLYIFVFKVNEEDPLLQQKSLTSEELTQLLANYKIEERYICSEKRPPSRFEGRKKLLREDDRFADYIHEWKLMKKKKKRRRAPLLPQCQTCKTTIQENMSCLLCRALYVPYEQHFVREKDFCFCPLKSCIKALPFTLISHSQIRFWYQVTFR